MTDTGAGGVPIACGNCGAWMRGPQCWACHEPMRDPAPQCPTCGEAMRHPSAVAQGYCAACRTYTTTTPTTDETDTTPAEFRRYWNEGTDA